MDITTISRNGLNRILNICTDWCAESMDPPFGGMVPSYRIERGEFGCDAGSSYEPHNVCIVLHPERIITLRELLKSFIHEWYHSTQDCDEYFHLLQVHGYNRHPHEKMARRYEKVYFLLHSHLLERLSEQPTSEDRRELWWANLRISLFGL
jgi:hypothetical protein